MPRIQCTCRAPGFGQSKVLSRTTALTPLPATHLVGTRPVEPEEGPFGSLLPAPRGEGLGMRCLLTIPQNAVGSWDPRAGNGPAPPPADSRGSPSTRR